MTFRGITELQEQSRNAARDGFRPEMDDKRWIPPGNGSWPEMDRDWIWMDDRRWMTGGGSRETDDNQSPSLL
jgi:hypothetical protein